MKTSVMASILAATLMAGCGVVYPEAPGERPFVTAQFGDTSMAQVSARIVEHCVEIGGKVYTPSADGVGCEISYDQIESRPPTLMAFGLELDNADIAVIAKMYVLFRNVEHPPEMFGDKVSKTLTEFLHAAGADAPPVSELL